VSHCAATAYGTDPRLLRARRMLGDLGRASESEGKGEGSGHDAATPRLSKTFAAAARGGGRLAEAGVLLFPRSWQAQSLGQHACLDGRISCEIWPVAKPPTAATVVCCQTLLPVGGKGDVSPRWASAAGSAQGILAREMRPSPSDGPRVYDLGTTHPFNLCYAASCQLGHFC
jgi:hypothetical protein